MTSAKSDVIQLFLFSDDETRIWKTNFDLTGKIEHGDPDDRTLRVMESDIVVRKRGVELAKDKCRQFMDAYAGCEQREQLMVYFKCRQEAKDMEVCLNKWINDAQFMHQVTEDYLDERSEYRRTGKSKKQREIDAMIQRYRQKKAEQQSQQT